jgi:hypothetical protein
MRKGGIHIKYIKQYKHLMLLFALGLIGLQSCTKDKTSMPVAVGPCDSLSVSFQADIAPIMNTYCTFSSCHTYGSGMGDFTNYSGVKSKVDNGQFENRVLNLKDMPPTYSSGPKSINSDDLQKIKCWIDDGAPDN